MVDAEDENTVIISVFGVSFLVTNNKTIQDEEPPSHVAICHNPNHTNRNDQETRKTVAFMSKLFQKGEWIHKTRWRT